MVRTKIKYELIADARTKRESFKKRRTGLFKKLEELRTLCNVEACGIVINGDGTNSDIWPSPNVASELVEKFRTQPASSSTHTNNRVNQIGYLRQNLSRISRNLDKETQKVESLEKELIFAEHVINGGANIRNSHELHEMLRSMEKKIDIVDQMIANLESI